MMNLYFPDEVITENDLYYLCYMIERVARKLHQQNRYVVNALTKAQWRHLISCAQVLHCENPLQVEAEWIREYSLKQGDFYIDVVDKELCAQIPAPTQMGKVYCRLIVATLSSDEDYIDGMVRVYNAPICAVIDNYNASAYYEPSYVIARAYANDAF